MKLTADLSLEMMEARDNGIASLKYCKKTQFRILYPQ